ncbi:hypothetical protein [Aliikangiella coralliicola]|uniref:Uncharacterized protein n=1 Tax=Aliikangiella coralliicola TaxID=2592383 RepID=A0A545UD25_9GAMM|nr:hypothetical protein [Aliikangiella coralliicola]TQV87367.1 hypothetical protein FLL46_13040 [Aliikangiella coralliicola]
MSRGKKDETVVKPSWGEPEEKINAFNLSKWIGSGVGLQGLPKDYRLVLRFLSDNYNSSTTADARRGLLTNVTNTDIQFATGLDIKTVAPIMDRLDEFGYIFRTRTNNRQPWTVWLNVRNLVKVMDGRATAPTIEKRGSGNGKRKGPVKRSEKAPAKVEPVVVDEPAKQVATKAELELTPDQKATQNYVIKMRRVNALKRAKQVAEAKKALANGDATTMHQYIIKEAEKAAGELKLAQDAVKNGTATNQQKDLVDSAIFVEKELSKVAV